MKTFLSSVLIIFYSSLLCNAQQINCKIDFIGFTLIHSKRIPNQTVVIKINNQKEKCLVTVISTPNSKDIKWGKTLIDTTFVINKNIFIDLANEALTLNKIDLQKAFTKSGLDGTSCTIEFGTNGNTVTYKFWTPGSTSEYRGLQDFLNLCKKIIKIAGLKVEEIL